MTPDTYSCPVCSSPVIAKPGRVKVPHFAHATKSHCPSVGESSDHLYAKWVLGEQFRAVGYKVTLEEPHSEGRRVDVAVTIEHPITPLRYAVEVQNSSIDPREMSRRFLADLKAGFWWTAWIFTGSRAKRLLDAEPGTEVRLPEDILAGSGPLILNEHKAEIYEQLSMRTDGLDVQTWMGSALAVSYGSIGRLRGIKFLDANGSLWHTELSTTRRGRAAKRGSQLQNTRQIDRKERISFKLFGDPWGLGDTQRLTLASELAEFLPDDNDTTVASTELLHFASQKLLVTPSQEFDDWVRKTIGNIKGWTYRGDETARSLKRSIQIFLYDIRNPLGARPNGWPAAPAA
ncbi:competence protein CoiA family protein [Saccharothrix sp. DSM 118769]